MFGIIYKITCKCNSKVYIGLTTSRINERWNQHKSKAHTGKYNLPICNAIQKYGDSNFTIEQIDVADSQEELKSKEIYWISYYNSTDSNFGYNVTLGGESTNGYYHSEEVKRLISEHSRGVKKSEETRNRMKMAQRKLALTRHIIPSEETRRKMSESRMGHETSKETREKISNSNKGKVRTEQQNEANSKRQLGKKWMHNCTQGLNIVALKDDFQLLTESGWEFGKVSEYTTIPRKNFFNMQD